MATKLDVTKSGKNLFIEHSGSNYVLKDTGVLSEVGKGKGAIAADDAKRVIEGAIDVIEEKGGKLPEKVRGVLGTHLKHFEKNGGDKEAVAVIEKNMKAVADFTAAAGKEDHGEMARILHKNKEIEHYFGKETDLALSKMKDPFSWAKQARYEDTVSGWKTLMEGSPTKESVRKFLIDNFEHEQFLTITPTQQRVLAQSKSGEVIDLKAIRDEVKTGVKDAEKEIKPLLKEIKAAGEEIERLKKAKSTKPEVLKKAQEGLTKLEGKLAEKTKGDFGSAAVHQIESSEKALVDGAKKASATVKSHVDGLLKNVSSGAGKAAEKSSKWWQKGAEELEKIAKKEGKAVSELGMFTKMNTATKIGGAAVILGAAYAAFGRKGKAADIQTERQQAELQAQLGGEGQVPQRA